MKKSEGRIKACTECRQQKLRCDAHHDYSKPCSRCRKMSLECKIQSSFKRVKKQTKAELQREIDRLKQQNEQQTQGLRTRHPQPLSCLSHRSEKSPVTSMIASPHSSTSVISENRNAGNLRSPPIAPSHSSSNSISKHSASGVARFPSPNISNHTATAPSSTLLRTLDGHEIDAKKIDDCFHLFFDKYVCGLPVVDPSLTPNQCYSQSSFLFWTIVFVGSRRYRDDPTLLGRLSPRINGLALASLASRDAPIPKIQGLLLLCSWPVPMNTMSKDVTNILSGAAIHLAMQIGLHIPGVGQDFERTRITPTESQRTFRARLWLHCLRACQSVSICEGLPLPSMTDFGDFERECSEMIMALPSELRCRQRIHTVQAAAVIAMMRNGLNVASTTQSSVINSLVKVFDRQLTNLVPECRPSADNLYLDCARVHTLGFYFFARSDCVDVVGITELYSVCQTLIESATILNESQQLAQYFSLYVHRMILMAAFSILKIHRSQLSQYLDLQRGEKSYFAAIRLCRDCSVEHDDLLARATAILSRLWTDDRVFKLPSGEVDSLSLRIRTRGSMSTVFDCLWWWRELFAGIPSPYQDRDATNDVQSLLEDTPGVQGNNNSCSEALMEGAWTDYPPIDFVPDYDWIASLDFPLESTELPTPTLNS